MKFKVGDRVRIKEDSEYKYQRDKMGVGIIEGINTDKILNINVQSINNSYTNTYNEYDLELVKKGRPIKEKPDDMVRYMVYGTGCNNKSNLFKTESELKTEAKKLSKDSSWTGRVIGYKLTPLFEAENKTVLKSFSTKVVKRGPGRPKKK